MYQTFYSGSSTTTEQNYTNKCTVRLGTHSIKHNKELNYRQSTQRTHNFTFFPSRQLLCYYKDINRSPGSVDVVLKGEVLRKQVRTAT